jgi:hypothetical protein
LDAVRGYVELGLRLGRHLDGLVDGYYGPGEIAAAVDAEPLRAPRDLVADALALRESLDGLDAARARWLDAQLEGLETAARRLDGERISFADEVEHCYGVRPRRVSEEVFEAAHRELDELLPGDGSLAERYAAWREADALPGDRYAAFAADLADELRRRTDELVGLPPAESVRFEVVHDEPWAAFNYYEGGLRSRIAINGDLPTPAERAVTLVAHETYPGHHTEHACKEDRLVRGQDRLEETILLIGTPQALIAEGIAEIGLDVLLADDVEAFAAERLAAAGVRYDADLARAVKRAAAPLAAVPANAALSIHEDGATEEEAVDYIVRWRLAARPRAEQNVRFVTDPLWRTYVTTYTDGERVCGAWVGRDPDRFRRLVTEQLTPADLTA